MDDRLSKEKLLQAGMEALRAGNKMQAASLFARAVKEDPNSEQGWFLLGTCCDAPDQREYCFRRTLALNPNHAQARRELQGMSKPAPASAPPFFVSEPALARVTDETRKEHLPVVQEKEVPPASQQAPSKISHPAKSQPRKKKLNPALAAFLWSIPILGLPCLAIGFFLFFTPSGQLFLSPAPATFSAPVALATLTPAIIPTETPAPPTPIPTPLPTVEYTASFEDAPCSFNVFSDADVRCGYLIVPEDRTGDPTHTIRLAVAVYKSFNSRPAPEPVLFLQGGPGAEAVQLSADAYFALVTPFLADHDFIVFDQRGTGLSEPNLQCEELTKTYLQDVHGLIPDTTRDLVYPTAFRSCQGLMDASGINLNAYTTVASAADVKDLLDVLGYQKVNLYGASYGTRLALVIMREYPQIVHSAILDSIVPVETNLFSKYPDSVASGLGTLFNNCAANPECNAAYPNLETVFRDLVTKLDANPVTVTTSNYPTGTITQTVNGSTVMNIILGSIKYSRSMISTAPQTIYRFNSGDFSTLTLSQSSMSYAFEGMSPGLFISMMCHEHILATTPEELLAASERDVIRDFAWLPFYGDMMDVYDACKSWGATPPAYGENDPVTSDIPTLIITGSFDPTTPPVYARQIAQNLSRSYYFEFPSLGHTPTATDPSGCAMDTALAFLDDPFTEPDRACLNEADPIDFVIPYTGNPALTLKTVKTDGITVNVPEEWHTLRGGFYYRGNSPLDITEAAVFRMFSSSSEIQDWFSLEAYGYRGLDSPLIESGRRQAHGLDWKLYLSSSYGRPVDIAMADDEGQTLVILLFCNSDEHDALYRTVFLPMVDSARR